ncbi:hypothetical protein WBP06_09725 [Novosphingobium sp. BL-8H]|uniref:hypothetical protein n=1 Tax=Novosphingobium sp. BL-8H TaxID=3127640 RepID=UPI003757B17C
MRASALIAVAILASGSMASAQAPSPAPQQATAAKGHYTTADTTIGVLLDDPASKAILTKYLPDVVKSDQIDMARGMTLRSIQQYSSETITDEKLAAIDAELARLPPKK